MSEQILLVKILGLNLYDTPSQAECIIQHNPGCLLLHACWRLRASVALFPGLPRLQFLIACGMQKLAFDRLRYAKTGFWSLAVCKNWLLITCGMQKLAFDCLRYAKTGWYAKTGSVFAYCKRSKIGAGEGLGTRLGLGFVLDWSYMYMSSESSSLFTPSCSDAHSWIQSTL